MIAALVVASLWLDPSAVAGDLKPAPPASEAKPAPPAGDPAVRPLVDRAAQQFNQGLLDDALATLEQAQRLSSDPAIVYNIAQVQRSRGDCPAALAAYSRYLETAGPADAKRDRATRWAAEMRACVDRTAPAHPVAPPADGVPALPGPDLLSKATGEPAGVPASPDSGPSISGLPPREAPSLPDRDAAAPPSSHVGRRRAPIVGWSLVAAGGLCEVAAILLQSKASGIQQDLDSEMWVPNDPRRSEQLRSGSRYANWALGMAIAGGALVAGGASVLIINLKMDPASPRSTVVGLAGTF